MNTCPTFSQSQRRSNVREEKDTSQVRDAGVFPCFSTPPQPTLGDRNLKW